MRPLRTVGHLTSQLGHAGAGGQLVPAGQLGQPGKSGHFGQTGQRLTACSTAFETMELVSTAEHAGHAGHRAAAARATVCRSGHGCTRGYTTIVTMQPLQNASTMERRHRCKVRWR